MVTIIDNTKNGTKNGYLAMKNMVIQQDCQSFNNGDLAMKHDPCGPWLLQ